MKRLYDRLEEYSRQDYYPFHMPGHKRNRHLTEAALPYEIDITEIEGFDDLHHAHGILLKAQQRAQKVFRTKETHFLVNGSTVGILSAILGCTHKKDKVLIARHCHKSVYHAVYLNELVPRYVYPEYDENRKWNGRILSEDVHRALEADPDIRAVVIVSPSYEGVVSDVAEIAEIVHIHGIPLIVDEAHGAHMGFHGYFPDSANELGADIVIHSLHKTLPSLTQTALMHINGELVNKERIRRYLDMLQSSSPSYVFMASLDACVAFLEDGAEEAFELYVKRLSELRNCLRKLKYFKLLELEAPYYDPSKLVISVANTEMTSHELYEKLLREYHLQMEMVAGNYVLAMTTVADTTEGFARLESALFQIEKELEETGRGWESASEARGQIKAMEGRLPYLEQVFTPYEVAENKEKGQWEEVSWAKSEGRVAMEYAYLYPPGSPLIVPGERLGRAAIELLCYYEQQRLQIEGLQKKGIIQVWKHE